MAIHPGRTLKHVLTNHDMSVAELAEQADTTPKRIKAIVEERANISPELAIKLEAVFGIEAEFWNNLQTRYANKKEMS